MEAGGGDVAVEAEGFDDAGLEGEDGRGGFVVVKLGEQGGETFHQGGTGGDAEVVMAVRDGSGEPDGRGAAANEMGIGALGSGDVGPALAASDEGGEALMQVFDDGVAGGELALLCGEGHGGHSLTPIAVPVPAVFGRPLPSAGKQGTSKTRLRASRSWEK